ncbi:hypothetical protein LJR225_001540 [Phenylobacterium sp. LjRoot225]|uniref:hypothetical protein n=1 Tax=Phenylobacterium sp. LjRoot225 TaxID=3342285 RepID=UPI003ECCA90E
MPEASDCVSVAVDAHVHIYEPVRALEALAQAAQNVRRRSGLGRGALLLTESAGFHVFDQLAASATPGGPIEATSEANALWFRSQAADLLIIAGRQLVSAEGVEILALGERVASPDGAPLEEMVDSLLARDLLVVAPWGVGKWLGRRKGLVQNLLETRPVHLGDNGGRPAVWRSPLFDAARRRGLNVLPGSDVLPIRGRVSGIGSFGAVVETAWDAAKPAHALLSALKNPATRMQRYGDLRGVPAFIADQLQLRLQKRRRMEGQ